MALLKWQDFLNILTLKGTDSGVLKHVTDAVEDVDKFSISLNANKCFLEEWLVENTRAEKKCASKCVDLRLTGNKVYQKGNDFEALSVYNSSVAMAPRRTIEFALAVANRSAVLGRLQCYEEAIQDIDLALRHGDTEIPRTKLLIRKAVFLHKLHLFEESLFLIRSLFPDEDEIRKHENLDLRNAYFDSLMETENNTKVKPSKTEQEIPLPKGGENRTFPSASAHVVLKDSKEKGRHVIAKEDFEPSNIIFVEKPFALVVLPDQYEHHCHHCCKKVVAFVPCEECTRAQFCSEFCRSAAWTKYHKWECRGLDVCHSIGIAHLGLRVALLADSSHSYERVCELMTHISDMKADDLYQYAITAALLTLYLKNYTSYFDSNPLMGIDEMGCRILRHIAQLICNGHAITKVDSTNLEKGSHRTIHEAQIRIATAIYPSASMMNHSCDQNISNSFINECLIVRASKPIKKGEEVFNCYGPQYKTMNRKERQKVLQNQYFFTCTCNWCSKSSECELQQFSALLCSHCTGPVLDGQANCAHCHRSQPLLEMVNLALSAQQLHFQGKRLLKEGDIKGAVTCLQESVGLSSKCLYKHNSDLRSYKDTLAHAYAELGNYHESILLTEECITSIEKQFGYNSVELSRELLKLFDVLSLDLFRLMEAGLQDSEEYRNKTKKMKRIMKRLKDTIELNVDPTYLSKIPEMAAALRNVELTEII